MQENATPTRSTLHKSSCCNTMKKFGGKKKGIHLRLQENSTCMHHIIRKKGKDCVRPSKSIFVFQFSPADLVMTNSLFDYEVQTYKVYSEFLKGTTFLRHASSLLEFHTFIYRIFASSRCGWV